MSTKVPGKPKTSRYRHVLAVFNAEFAAPPVHNSPLPSASHRTSQDPPSLHAPGASTPGTSCQSPTQAREWINITCSVPVKSTPVNIPSTLPIFPAPDHVYDKSLDSDRESLISHAAPGVATPSLAESSTAGLVACQAAGATCPTYYGTYLK